MTSTFLTVFPVFAPISRMFKTPAKPEPEQVLPSTEADLERRAFISEKLESWPGDMGCWSDTSALMSHFPGRF